MLNYLLSRRVVKNILGIITPVVRKQMLLQPGKAGRIVLTSVIASQLLKK